MPEPGKPKIYVSAFFCDKVLREANDLLTAIRVNQGYIATPTMIPAEGDDTDNPDPSRALFFWTPFSISAVITFLSESPAEFSYFMRSVAPDGAIYSPAPPVRLTTVGGAEGHTMNVSINFSPEKAGDHWFEIYVDDELVNKMALRIIHNKAGVRVLKRPSAHSPSAFEQTSE